MISLSALQQVAPQTSTLRLAAILPHLNACLPTAEITTDRRAAMFLGQTCFESDGFNRLEENLNYRAARLMAVWKERFPTLASAIPYEHAPQALASKVYALRLGNGDVESGDGWKFRGRGLIQLTGFDAYLRLSKETGTDYVGRPDLLAQPDHACLAAAHFWSWKWLNHEADAADVPGATKKIQGGTQGLADRQAAVERACAAFGIPPRI